MEPADLGAARRLQLGAGWNQTLADWEVFLHSTPDGCFVAVDDEGVHSDAPGSAAPVIGTATSIRYGARSCWISMVIVQPDFRGRGIASELMRTVIRANEDRCECLRLDATPAGRPVYEKLGFRPDYDLERWVRDDEGRTPREDTDVLRSPATATDVLDGPWSRDSAGGPSGALCRPLTGEDLQPLRRRDLEVFDGDRSAVLEHLLVSAPQCAWCTSGDAGLHSYVLGRAGEKRTQIGPIVAESEIEALALFDAAIAGAAAAHAGMRSGAAAADTAPADVTRGNSGMVIDIVAGKQAIRDAVAGAGFVFQRPFTRMTRGGSPDERLEAMVAIAGPEFG